MKIKYHKQETNYTCGPACMEMVLGSLGIKKSEKQISRLLKTNKRKGTWHKYLPELAERYKLDYIVERNGTIADLKRYLKNNWRIIVCFYYGGVAHYSVVRKINWHSIYLIDPIHSDNHHYFIPSFKKRWKDDEKEIRWFVAIKK